MSGEGDTKRLLELQVNKKGSISMKAGRNSFKYLRSKSH